MIEAVTTFATIIVILWACATCPDRMSCAPKWWIPEGVRENGSFTCRPVPIGGEYRDARGVVHDLSTQPPGGISGQVYCGGTPATHPVIEDDGRTVSCR